MYDPSSEAMKARAEARRKTMTLKVYRMGEEPEVDEDNLAMTPWDRFALGLRLTVMGYNLAEANNDEIRGTVRRLPRSAWPVHIIRR